MRQRCRRPLGECSHRFNLNAISSLRADAQSRLGPPPVVRKKRNRPAKQRTRNYPCTALQQVAGKLSVCRHSVRRAGRPLNELSQRPLRDVSAHPNRAKCVTQLSLYNIIKPAVYRQRLDEPLATGNERLGVISSAGSEEQTSKMP